MSRSPRSLRAQLLFDLGFLMSAAVLLVGLTTAVLTGGDLRDALLPLGLLWAGSTLVFVLFGDHLVRRLLLRPLRLLSAEADRLAEAGRETAAAASTAGTAAAPAAPAFGSRELAHLHERYRALAEELLDAQSQIVRVEKLAGIGRLAAGVAHEVRNPLGALATYVEVLRRRSVDPEVVGEMQTAVARIERTVQSLLSYARPGLGAGPVDMAAAVRTAVEFLAAQGRFRDHPLCVDYADAVPTVVGDRHALEQVVVNLLLNACDAAPGTRVWVGVQARSFEPGHRTQRRRTDTTGGPPPDREFRARPRRPDVQPGARGVFVYVADDGPGVPEEHRERIFDPFYTTKDPGSGTGLGLAIVARTVHEAGGVVWVDRAREGGAAFKIFLPTVD